MSWINIGSSEEISISDLANKIAKLTEFKGTIHWDQSKPDGTLRKKLDTESASSLGWVSKTSLDEGLKLTFENFLECYKSKILKT